MKNLFVFIFLFVYVGASSQQITCKVVDANSGAALPFATVAFTKTKLFLYTDISGQFSFSKNEGPANDTIRVQYLSYATAIVPVATITDGFVIRLAPKANLLQNITVTACNNPQTEMVNKISRKAKEYIGPGPETRMIIISRFANSKNLTGFVNTIELYSGSFIEKAQVPVRIHWYTWDDSTNMPGEEITDTSIIVYPYRQGWNKFPVPAKTIYYSNKGLVLGLEFIYPVEYKKQYASLTTEKERLDWLNDMNHRWKLGMQTTRVEKEGTFFIVNNEGVASYAKKSNYSYLKPAVRISIETCNQ